MLTILHICPRSSSYSGESKVNVNKLLKKEAHLIVAYGH